MHMFDMSDQKDGCTDTRGLTMPRISTCLADSYGIKFENIEKLVGYEDLNMKLTTRGLQDDHKEFTLKLSRYSEDDGHLDYYELQHKIMTYLRASDISVPTVIPTLHGDYHTVFFLPPGDSEGSQGDCKYIARVLTYLPGETFLAAGNPEYLLEGVGQLTGHVDTLLQEFCTDHVEMDTVWRLSQASRLEPLLEQYCDPEVIYLGRQVLGAYRDKLSPKLHLMQKGFIHGDINNCNILVDRAKGDNSSNPASNYRITGLLDFGDVTYDYYVYEIAVIMGDLMSSCLGKIDPLIVARSVLRGFREKFMLHDVELEYLKLTICVRLLQLYVLQYHSCTADVDNEYRGLECQENLQVCKLLWSLEGQQFMDKVVH